MSQTQVRILNLIVKMSQTHVKISQTIVKTPLDKNE